MPKQQQYTRRDINTFFIYHESSEIHGYPQLHDESAKIYYITEIHNSRFLASRNDPITHGNGNWIMVIKDVDNKQGIRSEIEIRSNKNLLSDYPPASYTPGHSASLSQRLYKVEEVDHCF